MNAVAIAIILVVFINIYLLLYAQGIELVSYVTNAVTRLFSSAGEYAMPMAIVTAAVLLCVAILFLRGRKK